MGYEIQIIAGYTTLLLVLGAAWVGGYLDSYQHAAQDFVLGKAGENRASFGIKKPKGTLGTVSGQRVTDNKDVNKVQDDIGNTAGGLVGKGGAGQAGGDALSKGL